MWIPSTDHVLGHACWRRGKCGGFGHGCLEAVSSREFGYPTMPSVTTVGPCQSPRRGVMRRDLGRSGIVPASLRLTRCTRQLSESDLVTYVTRDADMF